MLCNFYQAIASERSLCKFHKLNNVSRQWPLGLTCRSLECGPSFGNYNSYLPMCPQAECVPIVALKCPRMSTTYTSKNNLLKESDTYQACLTHVQKVLPVSLSNSISNMWLTRIHEAGYIYEIFIWETCSNPNFHEFPYSLPRQSEFLIFCYFLVYCSNNCN